MCDLNLKITEMQKLVDSLEDGHVKTEMLCILTDIRLLQKSELQSESGEKKRKERRRQEE